MIYGIGTDLAAVARIAEAMERRRESFAGKVFTPAEMALGRQRSGSHADCFFAGRWAAKEAAAKALGCGFGKGCSPNDIEVLTSPGGAPVLNCNAPAFAALQKAHPAVTRWIWHISISHEKETAAAFVILEGLTQ